MNVLVDDNERAVLCDFGLSHIKADVRSNTSMFDTSTIIGSRNWMAPERLMGGSVRKPLNIYAFGIIIYEVKLLCSLSDRV
jgi:serine/threonine protein kinase